MLAPGSAPRRSRERRRSRAAGSSSSRARRSPRATSCVLNSAPLHDRPRRAATTSTLARRRVRLVAPRARRAAARRRLGRGRRLDERHLRERRSGSTGREAAAPGDVVRDRRDRAEVRDDERSAAQSASVTDTGPQAPAQRGLLRLRAAAVRGRRRDGRRAGGRDRLAARGRGAARARTPSARRRGARRRRSSRRRTAASTSGRRADASASGMGTTMTVALVEDGRVTIGHVGDSRAYLVRDGKLEQLTRRPLARRRADPQRQALARGGRDAPAALGDHARARHRPRRRRRHVLGRDAGRATSSCSAPTG